MVTISLLLGAVIGTVVYMSKSMSINGQCLTENDELRSPLSVEGLLNGSTDFGFNVFTRLAPNARHSESNMAFSPFSIWSALLMTYLGARGRTEDELNYLLGLKNASKADSGRAYKAVKYWYKLRSEHQINYTLNLANSLFLERTFPLRDCIETYFGSEISRVDFQRAPEAARAAINSWVEKETKNKIRDLFPPGMMGSSTLIAIVNAAYFKGKWQSQFKKENTRKEVFHVTPGRDVMIDMMHQTNLFYHGISADLDAQVLEMPFISEEVSMIFFLPLKDFLVDSVVRELSTERIRWLRHELRKSEVEVAIPKFRVENNFEMTQLLTQMGLRDLFIPSQSNLSGFSDDRRLAVSTVRHKAFLEVNEEGSEAAAATGILAWRSARPLSPTSFIANKPFIFMLHDNLSNVVLFLGVVNRPEITNDV
uniref:Serpin domain-containing protein n=1 Tax=Strigamia maritima TaxID=126957 RepID=T1JHQ7_STRMM